MKTITRTIALQGVTDALLLFPLSLSVGALSGFGMAGGVMSAVVALLCGCVLCVSFTPTYLLLLPVFTAAYRFGAGVAAAAVLLGGAAAFFLSFLPQKLRAALHQNAVGAGFLLAAAFVTTVLQTTNYFGIGAVGGTAPEMLRDYVSLGFHPNWRGILYGTMVMVILITYPRKFKRLSQKLPSVFASLLVTFPLHLLLVPDEVHSPVEELGAFSLRTLPDGLFLRGAFTPSALPLLLCSALSLALLMTANLPKPASQKLSAVSVIGGFLGGVPLGTDGAVRSRWSFLISVPLTVGLYCVPGLARMPLPSLAVILIVTAWQCVDWSGVRRALTWRSLPFFLCGAVLPVLFGVHYAVPLLWVLGIINNKKRSVLLK